MASTSSNGYGDTLQVTTATNNVADVTLNMTALGAVLAFSKASIAFSTTPPNTPSPSRRVIRRVRPAIASSSRR